MIEPGGKVAAGVSGGLLYTSTDRIDGEYLDGRHPEKVTFTPSLLEDLKRRDFTVNAMAYNDREGLVDAFDGLGDLKRGQIRCVGDPRERFTEDALRILRAVRFSAQLDFAIEEKTKAALSEFAPRPVSYTHLDVYKRQEMFRIFVSILPARTSTAWASSSISSNLR